MSRTWFPFVVCFLLITCKNEKTNTAQDPGIKSDSILSLIKKGRDKNRDVEEREYLLRKAMSKSEDSESDTLRSKYFSQLSLAYLNINDSLKFRASNKLAIQSSKTINDSVALSEAYWDLASFFSRRAIRDSAFYYYAEAQKTYEAINSDLYAARMLYNMAVEQARVKDYTGSEINAIKAIELLKPLEEYRYLYNCYNLLGANSKDLKEFDNALEYYENALSFLRKSKINTRVQLDVINNIGNVFLEKGLFKEAEDQFEIVLSQDSLIQKHPELYARVLNNSAFNSLQSGKVSGVKELLFRGLRIRDSLQDLTGISGSNYNISKYYLKTQDTVNAIFHAEQSKLYAEQSNNNGRLLQALGLLVTLDPDKAVFYNMEYVTLSDSLQQAERRIRNKFARIRFETDEFKAENELLARQRQLWIGIAIGLLMLATAVFVIISQRIKNQRLKFEQQQQEANQEIFNLMLTQNQKLEEGKQSEQKRISEELHDGILGQMNGIRMVLLGLNKKVDESSVGMRSDAIEKLQQVQEEIRTISHELSDAAYQKFHNFIHSIEDLLKSITAPAQITYSFEYNEEVDWDDLNGNIKINLYRIVQEGLQNCVKHAQAKKVRLNFDSTANLLEISLSDDGKGFDPRKGKKGIGHKNITSRVDKLNGRWELSSKIGKGTELILQIPYEGNGHAKDIDFIEDTELEQV